MRRAFMSIEKGFTTYSEGMTLARRTLNLGILAHVDAGKTTLTERLLYAAGVIDEVGSVDDGTTQTDTLALERQRGITIKSAVVSFVIDDVTVNLIDTPGHPDFIAEVERVLSVLDGAVLVVSAVEGVQPQTRLLMRALARLRIPTLLFVNKIDRAGAGYERVLDAIAERLTPAIVAMGAVDGLGTRAARFAPWAAGDAALATRLTEVLAEQDDSILAAYVEDNGISYRRLRAELAQADGAGARAPGLLRLGDHGCGRGVADGGDRGAAAGDRRRRRRPCVGHCLQDRARSAGEQDRLRAACSPAPSEHATGCTSAATPKRR